MEQYGHKKISDNRISVFALSSGQEKTIGYIEIKKEQAGGAKRPMVFYYAFPLFIEAQGLTIKKTAMSCATRSIIECYERNSVKPNFVPLKYKL